jgi:Restriction endonuclease
MVDDSSEVLAWLQRYPPADLTPREFEEWVGDVFASVGPGIDDLRVQLHERVTGTDGSYEFDATVRYRWAGLDFLVLVEAKRQANPIKRELVQALHSKIQSVGARKGVLISTAPFQRGAVEFANAHGIALVSLTEGRFTFETRALGPRQVLSREQALDLFGLPTFVGFCFGAGETPDSLRMTTISTDQPDHVGELLLGVPKRK